MTTVVSQLLRAADLVIRQLGGGIAKPPENERIVIADTADGFTVELIQRAAMYSPWSKAAGCFDASMSGLSGWFSTVKPVGTHPPAKQRTILMVTGRQPSLRTYDGPGPANDGPAGITWNAAKVEEAVAYIRRTIDSGRPVLVGVAELDQVTRKDEDDDTSPRINDGVTDHFLLISGYRVAGGRVVELLAVDNATAEPPTPPVTDIKSYPTFAIAADGSIVRAGKSAKVAEYAEEMQYSLTMVRVYESDVADAQKLGAWRK